ncbi:hypothetical protein BDB00DRAFT_786038 [Zychaea mexicana]|uniref:uncharacterized protein n=1 Tax=Zychaea mexicana TaxID=64656 RepID=UPI0022FEAFD5|nr:uncharacterized protein BDB00DRAFT_786038 [Zychaea mexicana]KAI9495801.1 hypothetical protein BDB00DRAFT_786038 [Zychaea mexicana]
MYEAWLQVKRERKQAIVEAERRAEAARQAYKAALQDVNDAIRPNQQQCAPSMYQSFKKKSTPSPYFEDIVFEQDIKEPELHWQERKMLSTLDRWYKLKEFDVQPPDALRLRETPKTIAHALGFTKFKLPIPQQHHLAFTYMLNPEANPGPQYKAKGYQTKQQGYDRAMVEAARVY